MLQRLLLRPGQRTSKGKWLPGWWGLKLVVSCLLLQSVSTWNVQWIFGLLACHSLIVGWWGGSKLGKMLWPGSAPWHKGRCWLLKIFEYNLCVEWLAYYLETENGEGISVELPGSNDASTLTEGWGFTRRDCCPRLSLKFGWNKKVRAE